MTVATTVIALHFFVFAGVAVFLLVAILKEPYLSNELSLPAFLSLAVAVGAGVAWNLL